MQKEGRNLEVRPSGKRIRRRKKSRIWLYVTLAFVFVIAAGIGALFASSGLLDKEDDSTVEEGLLTAHDKSTVMIMGVDERDDDVGRSDTLMVAAIDPKKNKASLLSIPRDTRVKIKGHSWDKINAAYAYGGEKLTQRTVEDFLGLNIDHYVIINTKSFQKIIDAIGGIDIDVEKRMKYEDPWDDDGGLVIDLQPGMQHMDGKTAVTYVRYRDEEGDIGRIKRQQKFMKACMDKLVSPAIIPHLPSIIKEVMSSIKTDLSFRQILEFAGTLKEAQKNGLQTEMVPGKPLYIKGISYWIPDIKKLRNTVAETLNVQITSSARTNLDRTEAEYRNSIPADAKEVPANEKSIGHFSSSTMSSTTSSESATYSSHSTGRSTGSEVERSTERRRSSNAASPSSESSGSNTSGESSLDSGAPTQSSGRKTQ